MSIAILEHVPDPVRKRRVETKPRASKYPFEALQVNQGFFAESKSIVATAGRAAKRFGHKYKTYAGEQDGKAGRFVKRIA